MGIHQHGICHLTQVPLRDRRSPFTMGLLWITMVTGFPAVLIGFDWYRQGFSFSQVIIGTLISCLLLLAYAIPASQFGAKSGLGYCGLSRAIFGRWGTWLVTANLVWLFTAWYGMTAVWMARAVSDLLHVHASIMWMGIAFAFLMAFNNFFGFTGIANFARFFAAPALIAWIGYTFIRALSATPISVFAEVSHQPTMYALTTISSFVIGFAAWGNEADYWRFSKAGSWRSAIPIGVALLIGEMIFPVAGWLVARMSGVTDNTAATALMNNYSFGGMAVIGLIILTALYFAQNDSNLFGMAAAVESLWPMKHKKTVTLLAVLGAVTAAFLSITDSAKALETVAALNCVFAPTPTVIMLTEWYLREKIFSLPIDFSSVPEFFELPAWRWPAAIALFSGFIVGIGTAGLIPGLEQLHIGICPLQAWLTSAFVYGLLRYREYAQILADRKIILEAGLSETPEPAMSDR